MLEHLGIYNTLTMVIFTLGYILIIFEHKIVINKATSALFMAIGCWFLQFLNPDIRDMGSGYLLEHLASVSQIIIFLLSAMTIVEAISVHGGLNYIMRCITTKSRKKLVWIIGILTFFLSSVLDNLTTTIVMISIFRKLFEEREDKLIFGCIAVIAANAGGAWTPIGDVTTTMLWVDGQLSAFPLMANLFVPSIASLIASMLWFTWVVDGSISLEGLNQKEAVAPGGAYVFTMGILALVAVPFIQAVTGLPPFMSILFSLAFIWITIDLLHHKHPERSQLRMGVIFSRVDITAIFFFLGILLGVAALETGGILKSLAELFDYLIPVKALIPITIGLASSVIDNVPLVAGCMAMYDLVEFPMDSQFWQLVAYCAGTGGSILLIGSAAGVAFASMEDVDFLWYVKKASIPALLGYFAGVVVYFLMPNIDMLVLKNWIASFF